MVVNREYIKNKGGTKACYRELIKVLSSIPLEYNSIIYHVIGSYYGRKYLNLHPEIIPGEYIPEIETLRNEYHRILNELNHDFVLDLPKLYRTIQNYIRYYKQTPFHEWVSLGLRYPIPEYLTKSEACSYYYLGLDMVMSPIEYHDILRSENHYHNLALAFATGIKYLKDKYSGNLTEKEALS